MLEATFGVQVSHRVGDHSSEFKPPLILLASSFGQKLLVSLSLAA